MSYYIHNVLGRLRVKSPVIKRNQDAEYELRKALSTLKGVATIEINLTSGSLLVNYNPSELKSPDIVSLLKNRGYIDTSKLTTNDQYIQSAASRAGNLIGKIVFGAVMDKTLEGSAL